MMLTRANSLTRVDIHGVPEIVQGITLTSDPSGNVAFRIDYFEESIVYVRPDQVGVKLADSLADSKESQMYNIVEQWAINYFHWLHRVTPRVRINPS